MKNSEPRDQGNKYDELGPLTPTTFRARLNALSEGVQGVEKLRKALLSQHPDYAVELSKVSGSAK